MIRSYPLPGIDPWLTLARQTMAGAGCQDDEAESAATGRFAHRPETTVAAKRMTNK